MGFQLKNDAAAYGFKNFVKEMFFDSETMMVVISGVPGREILRDRDGKVLVDMERTPGKSGKPRSRITASGLKRAMAPGYQRM